MSIHVGKLPDDRVRPAQLKPPRKHRMQRLCAREHKFSESQGFSKRCCAVSLCCCALTWVGFGQSVHQRRAIHHELSIRVRSAHGARVGLWNCLQFQVTSEPTASFQATHEPQKANLEQVLNRQRQSVRCRDRRRQLQTLQACHETNAQCQG